MAEIDLGSFFFGVFIGAIIVGVYGVVSRRILQNLAGSRTPDQTQRVAHQTALTPREVIRAAARAFARFIAWSVFGIVLLMLVMWFFYMVITEWS